MLQSATALLKLQTLVPEHCLCNSQTLPARLSKPARLALRRETEKNASRDESSARKSFAKPRLCHLPLLSNTVSELTATLF